MEADKELIKELAKNAVRECKRIIKTARLNAYRIRSTIVFTGDGCRDLPVVSMDNADREVK